MSLSPIALLSLSFSSLLGSPLRSVLTTVGVFMGVAAVSATLQVENISRTVIAQQLAEREAPQIMVSPEWNERDTKLLTLEELIYLQKRLVNAKAMGTSTGTFFETALFQDQIVEPEIWAISLQYFTATGREKVSGRLFSQNDFDNFSAVAIIDQLLVNLLFKGVNPIGKRIYLDSKPFIVVGVVESKIVWAGAEEKGFVFLPLSTYSALSGRVFIWEIAIRPHTLDEMEILGEKAKKLLEQRLQPQTFETSSNVEDILEQKQTLEMVSRGLLAVGAIALLVGGVGIANITIASVIERTPEIGLRRAIGATQIDIMWQFILEATLLSLVGGIMAIITVHGITIMVANTFELPYQFDWNTSLLALGSAVGVGVGAVFIPSVRASQLDPVKALRSQ